MSITETKDGVILTIFVKPNSPKFKIELDGDEIVVYSTEEPVKGKVNKEIIKELTKLFHKVRNLFLELLLSRKSFSSGTLEKRKSNLLFTINF